MMAFSLQNIQTGVQPLPRKVLIYGPPKLGKSTLAGSVKDVLLIPTENRVAHINCAKTPVIEHYEEIFDIFDFLLNEKHQFKRVAIDTIDWLEPLLHDYICRTKGFKSITDDSNKETAFQKGLKFHAVEQWKKFLRNCDVLREQKGIDIILVAHAQIITLNLPDADPYDKFVMKIDKNSLAVVEEWADVIAFYNQERYVKTEKSGINQTKGKVLPSEKRILYLSGKNPAMINGNSYGLSDAEVSLENCSDIMEWMLTENNNSVKPDSVEPVKESKKKG